MFTLNVRNRENTDSVAMCSFLSFLVTRQTKAKYLFKMELLTIASIITRNGTCYKYWGTGSLFYFCPGKVLAAASPQ